MVNSKEPLETSPEDKSSDSWLCLGVAGEWIAQKVLLTPEMSSDFMRLHEN